MDDTGQLTRKISKSKFDAMASIIVEGMRSGDLSTRSLNSVRSPRFKRLMEELREVKEPKSSRSRKGGSGGGSRKRKGSSSGKGNSRTPNSGSELRPGRKRHHLDLGQIILPDSYPVATQLCIQE